MKKLTSIILILFLSLLSSPSWSETLTIDDLVERDDLYYQKFTNVPFTGKITGIYQGSFKDGVQVGFWVFYHENGQLMSKGELDINGHEVGEWVGYHDNGQLSYKNQWDKNGLRVGEWVYYHENGQLMEKGEYKNGNMIGKWVVYWDNGQLKVKGEYKDGKRIKGEVVHYNKDGTIRYKETY